MHSTVVGTFRRLEMLLSVIQNYLVPFAVALVPPIFTVFAAKLFFRIRTEKTAGIDSFAILPAVSVIFALVFCYGCAQLASWIVQTTGHSTERDPIHGVKYLLAALLVVPANAVIALSLGFGHWKKYRSSNE